MKQKIFGVKGIKRLNGKLLVLGIYQLNPKLKKWIIFKNIENKEEIIEKIKDIYEKFNEILKNRYFKYFEEEFNEDYETEEDPSESENYDFKENLEVYIPENKNKKKIKLIYF